MRESADFENENIIRLYLKAWVGVIPVFLDTELEIIMCRDKKLNTAFLVQESIFEFFKKSPPLWLISDLNKGEIL